MTPPTECACCERALDEEELECPYRDSEGRPLCDECHHEMYEFTCSWCQNYEHIDHQHLVLLVFDSDLEVPPGVYRITEGPYYTSPLIGKGWLHPRCLERLCDLPPGLEKNGYPCGHLCQECQQKIKELV